MRAWHQTCLVLIVLSMSGCAPANATEFEIVISDGRVIDPETGLDAIRYLGINDRKIAAISESTLTGKRVVDATGLIVSPGFIDLHSHSLELTGQRMQAFDGVTTALELESGVLPISASYEKFESEGRVLNYGFSAAWAWARIAAMIPEKAEIVATPEWYLDAYNYPRWTTDTTDSEELSAVIARLDDALRQGALGIGINAGYVPGAGGKEFVALSELAVRHKVPTFTHLRDWSLSDPNSTVEGLNTLIGLAATTGVHSHVCHLNSSSLKDAAITVQMIEAARDQGVRITTEAYPYGGGTFPVSSAILLQERDKFVERIGVDFDRVRLIAKGRQIVDEADIRMEQEQDPGQFVVLEYLDEKDPSDLAALDASVTLPWAAIASDAVPWNYPDGSFVVGDVWPLPEEAASNPRSAGTFAKFLGRWVRERKVMDWPDAIRKVSLIPAQILEESVPQMRTKGRIQVGMDADITIFDPATIVDRATVGEPAQTSIGVRYLMVNGEILIDEGELDLNIRPGQAIRRPVTTN